jgi:hypothetical protein
MWGEKKARQYLKKADDFCSIKTHRFRHDIQNKLVRYQKATTLLLMKKI